MTGGRMAEVAAEANVSVATVSRVVNGRPNVRPETREAVLRAMALLGVGMPTRALVGLILPETANPFFSALGFFFQRQLNRLGLHLLIGTSEGKAENELALVNAHLGLGLKGLIYISTGTPSPVVLEALARDDVPVVVFDRRVQDGNLDFVATDNRTGIHRAVDYLVSYGHSRIGYLGGLDGTRTAIEREEAFHDAMNRSRLDVDPDSTWPGNYQFAAGIACAEHLLSRAPAELPTAIVCANDVMAIGLMQRVQQEGWALPRDLSVIGFDNIAMADCVFPRLTTVEQPVERLAYLAVELLTNRIQQHEQRPGTAVPPRFREVSPTVIPRDSVAEPRPRPPASGGPVVELIHAPAVVG